MIGSLVAASALVAQAQAGPTPATARWVLRDDAAMCFLERQNVDPPGTFSIETVPGSGDYRLVIVARDIGKATWAVRGKLSFGVSPKSRGGYANVTKLANRERAIWMEGVAPSVLDDLAAADRVTISAENGASGSIALADSGKAVEALRHCVTAQLIEWGADPAQFAPGGSVAVATKPWKRWLPTEVVKTIVPYLKPIDAEAVFRVGVSPAGVIDGCQAVDPKTGKDFEKHACAAVMKQAMFTPAKDASGHPVRGVGTFELGLVLQNFTKVVTMP